MLTLGISTARMVSIVVVEVVCMRYGIAGGLLVMGGPGVIPSGNGKPPSSEELSPEELAELEKQLRNKLTVVEQHSIIVPYENTLPDKPSTDESKFLEDVVNNLEAFKGMKINQYTAYERQYMNYRKKNPNLSVFFHEDFQEFLSCIRPMIVNSSDENGNVKTVACPVDGGKKIDFIVNDVGFQSKVVRQFSAGDLYLNRKKYGVYIEAFATVNFRNQIIYNQLVDPAQMKTCVQENPDYLQGQELLNDKTYPKITKVWLSDYFEHLSKNAKYLGEMQEIIKRKDGHISLITRQGKTASIQEIPIQKSPDRPGCSSKIFKVVSVSQAVKKIQTIKDCIKRLNAILYNFFVTDLIMHKHGVMYESEGYKKRTFKRLQHLFKNVEKTVANQNKKNILEVLQKKEEEFDKQLKIEIEEAKKKNEERIYIPEEATLAQVRVADWMIWRDIKAMLEGEKNAEKTVADIFELQCYVMEKSFKYCRKNLQNYGYIPKKEKRVQYLKRK